MNKLYFPLHLVYILFVLGKCTIVHGRARHPQSQGLVEQANGTLKTMLAAMKQQEPDELKKRNWPAMLPYVMFNLNTVKQTSTNETPYKIVFNKKANLADKGI